MIIGPLYKRGLLIFKEPLIFVDGGVNFQENTLEGFSVGDGDSANVKLCETLPKEKDFSDLSYVLSQLPSHFSKIYCYGFLGGRRDHEYANMIELTKLLEKQNLQIELNDHFTLYSSGEYEFKLREEFSLMPLALGSLAISGECQYHFSGEVDQIYSSHFISNIGHGMVKIVNTMPIGLYRYHSLL